MTRRTASRLLLRLPPPTLRPSARADSPTCLALARTALASSLRATPSLWAATPPLLLRTWWWRPSTRTTLSPGIDPPSPGLSRPLAPAPLCPSSTAKCTCTEESGLRARTSTTCGSWTRTPGPGSSCTPPTASGSARTSSPLSCRARSSFPSRRRARSGTTCVSSSSARRSTATNFCLAWVCGSSRSFETWTSSSMVCCVTSNSTRPASRARRSSSSVCSSASTRCTTSRCRCP
mmetsp:Transcript_13732/g.31746  ORF Transcript_13732/g.31746 Transcript_13732/m.31746 type:complete len:234 (-) Transcript_13732:3282-3983(-)